MNEVIIPISTDNVTDEQMKVAAQHMKGSLIRHEATGKPVAIKMSRLAWLRLLAGAKGNKK